MKATAHWLELKGHRPKSPSILFDEVFSEQVFATGKIEDGRTVKRYFKLTGQALQQPWLIEMVKRLLRHLPVKMLLAMGLANVFQPRTKGWAGARAAIAEYVEEQEARQRRALKLDGAPAPTPAPAEAVAEATSEPPSPAPTPDGGQGETTEIERPAIRTLREYEVHDEGAVGPPPPPKPVDSLLDD